MNITTFNDVFERPFIELEGTKHWELMKKSPLFVHEMDFQVSIKKYIDEIDSGTRGRFPYNRFRLCLTLVDHDSGMGSEEHYLLTTSDRGFTVYYFVARHDMDKGNKPNVMMRFELVTDESGYGTINFGELKCRIIGHNRWMSMSDYVTLTKSEGITVSMVNLTNESKMATDAMIKESVVASTALIGTFTMDVMTPTNHLVVVRPDREGKSVQWVEQRTHYTLIHHGHPANKKEITEGQNVEVDRGKELTRMAHGRRAHQRTLRAARFTYARGKTIFVRSAWIGPKEWKEKGSKQIYRILDPVDQVGSI
jgi:hypothetical protein